MSIKLDFKYDKPKFRRPELLQHPTIPERLFGVNPRGIEGREWWDRIRRAVYEENNFCCWACSQHKSKDRFHQWLEAHEVYNYNTETCIVTLREIVALCPTCHMFIHIGNTHRRHVRGELTISDLRDIIIYGFETLKTAKLESSWGAIAIAERVFSMGEIQDLGIKYLPAETLKRSNKMLRCHNKWKLLYRGKYYHRNNRGVIVIREAA